MGQGLHKLGKFIFEHGWWVIAGWLVVIALLGWAAAAHMKPTSSAISIPGTEGQKAIDRMNELFPDAGAGSGRIVFEAPQGKTLDEYRAVIDKTATDVRSVPHVTAAITPFENPTALSKDKTIGFLQLQLKGETGSIPEETLAATKKAAEAARTSGLTVERGGDIIDKVPGEILGVGEIAGVVLALLVLVATLGSLVAAGMPIVTAVVGIGVSMAGLFSLSQVMTINTTTPVLAVMLGLAVGIDYSLFIISRYRGLVIEGVDLKDAAGKALGTAGNAVVFAATTVVIALASLAIVQIPFMTTMGLTAAAAIAVAAAVALTLIPALLGVVGMHIFTKKQRARLTNARKKAGKVSAISHKTIWYKWGALITRRPWAALGVSALIIAALAWPVLHLNLGLPTDEYAAKDSTERKAYDLLAKGFGVGFNGPLLLVVEGLPQVTQADKDAVRSLAMKEYETKSAAAEQAAQAAFQQKAAAVTTYEGQLALQQEITAAQAQGEQQKQAALAEIDKAVEQNAKLVQLKKKADEIAKVGDVAQVLPAAATEDGTKGIIQLIPQSAPSDKKTTDLIEKLRDGDYQKSLGVSLAVTGSTALQNDINAKLATALPEYLAVVVGLSLVLLIVAFRSILVPIKATAGFLLSVLAMFGVIVAIFQWGWFGVADAPGPIVSFVPIIAIGILFGLAMDYEFFLVSSMHESYAHTGDAKRAVTDGFAMGSKVVTAAGVIMVAVFAGFIGNHDATVQTIGFGLAIGIFVDAFIVRMTIVPAVMTLLGKSAWWLPSWLDKRLPHLSIEGEE